VIEMKKVLIGIGVVLLVVGVMKRFAPRLGERAKEKCQEMLEQKGCAQEKERIASVPAVSR
jgi:hypothetical protein